MLNPKAYYNSRPDGFAVLEVVDDNPAPDAPRRFVPLTRTDLAGTVTGPLATLSLTQTFSLDAPAGAVIEAHAPTRSSRASANPLGMSRCRTCIGSPSD